jgi:hypothetical protein
MHRDELDAHPDRLKWNAKHGAAAREFAPHPLLAAALAHGAPEGPALELACGLSGTALALAQAGRTVVAVDISDVALRALAEEAERRGAARNLIATQADLQAWDPGQSRFALVLCTRYWDAAVLARAAGAVQAGGLLALEPFSPDELRYRPSFRREWCADPEDLAALAGGFQVLEERAVDDGRGVTTRFIARRR